MMLRTRRRFSRCVYRAAPLPSMFIAAASLAHTCRAPAAPAGRERGQHQLWVLCGVSSSGGAPRARRSCCHRTVSVLRRLFMPSRCPSEKRLSSRCCRTLSCLRTPHLNIIQWMPPPFRNLLQRVLVSLLHWLRGRADRRRHPHRCDRLLAGAMRCPPAPPWQPASSAACPRTTAALPS